METTMETTQTQTTTTREISFDEIVRICAEIRDLEIRSQYLRCILDAQILAKP